jgi:hypothetical protein
MMFMNEYDVEETVAVLAPYVDECPNLGVGMVVRLKLVNWTNANSDGWCYWPKPVRAAKSLMEALSAAKTAAFRGDEVVDLTDAQLAKVLRPVRAFLTREGASFVEVVA